LREVWKHHRFPESIISDRDTKWTTEFWDRLGTLLGTKKMMSTYFHSQTDGQMEGVNQTLETCFCTFINYDQDD
jgi:hypothetical protein